MGPLDLAREQMYWGEVGGANIWRANLDGTGVQILVTGLSNPNVVALDLTGGKMYWCNQGSGEISRGNLDGSSRQILVRSLNSPIGIVLDKNNRHTYWANSSDIQRANLDGTAPQVLISGLSRAGIVTLDLISDGPPMIQFSPQNQSVLAGGNVTFLAGAAGAKPLFYQWQFNGVPLNGETNTTLQFLSVSTPNAGDYRVTVSNSLGVATSVVARVVVVDSPIIIAQPFSRSIVESNSVSFSVNAFGVAPLN